MLQSELFESLRSAIRKEDWDLEREWLGADENKDGLCSFEEFVQYYNSMQMLRLETAGLPPQTRTVRHYSSFDEDDEVFIESELSTSATVGSPQKDGLTIDVDVVNGEGPIGNDRKPPAVVKLVEGKGQPPFFDKGGAGSPSGRLTPLASPFRKRRASAVMTQYRPFTGFARPPVNQRQNGARRPGFAGGITLKVMGSGKKLR